MSRIPWPVPDATKLPDHRYKDVFESCGDEGDDSRSPDVWQPRHNIKKMFHDGTLKLDNEEAILYFSNKKNYLGKGIS